MIVEMARASRSQWPLLLGAALLIFIPLALIEVLDEAIQDPLQEVTGEVEPGRIVVAAGSAFGHAAAALLGEVLYAGVVAAAVLAAREGREHTLRQIARKLPYGRLILADLLWVLAVATGLLLLIVPGLIAMAWFALIGPVIEIEQTRVVEGFRRSADLVRGHTLRVLALILPVLVIAELCAIAAQSGSIWVFGDTLLGEWLAAAGAHLLTSPVFALGAVVLFFELRQPARSSSSARAASR